MTSVPTDSPPAKAAALRAALDGVTDPASGLGLAAAGLIDGIDLAGDTVRVSLRVRPGQAQAMERAADQARAALLKVPGITRVSVVLTAHREAAAAAAPARAPTPPAARPKLLGHVRRIVAVASGKGGVGKSTTAVNLAVALARTGLRVGLLDADVYGPSLPAMLGAHVKPEVRGDRIQPVAAWGLRAMSIGFMADPEIAMIWRGPMVMGALEQMLGQVDWGPLDIMVLDLPPGTGDAQLSLTQRLAITGAVIVSTPQDIALIDARRGVRMFQQTKVPILGLVENMSFFCCPACGARSEIFGHGGARAEAAKMGVSFLGEIPLLADIRRAADDGAPIVAAAPDHPAAIAYVDLAARVWELVQAAA